MWRHFANLKEGLWAFQEGFESIFLGVVTLLSKLEGASKTVLGLLVRRHLSGEADCNTISNIHKSVISGMSLGVCGGHKSSTKARYFMTMTLADSHSSMLGG